MADNNISLLSLDPSTLKDAFREHLKTQSIYKDFDFEGSNISTILNVLAYNTFLTSFYTNMAISEAFLDSAKIRNSILSHAKALNYLVGSKRSASTTLTLKITSTGIDTLVIPRGTKFTGAYSGKSFTFITEETVAYNSSNNTFNINDLKVYEGFYLSDSYVMDYSNESQKFITTDERIDLTSLLVSVVDSDTGNEEFYTYKTSLLDVTKNDKVFFVENSENNSYQIVFGDGNIGFRPKNFSVIRLTYRVCSAEEANGARTFSLNDDIVGASGGTLVSIEITSNSPAAGGTDRESDESIKFNAPRHYATQENAITSDDYASLILSNFRDVKDVYAFGGEDLDDTPQYGKIYVSCSTFDGNVLTDNRKKEILDFIYSRGSANLYPSYLDPDYTYVLVFSTVYYEPGKTFLSPVDLKEAIKLQIKQYNTSTLNSFNSELKYSRFLDLIDSSDTSISSNETYFKLFKRIVLAKNISNTFKVYFQNSLAKPGDTTISLTEYDPTFISTRFIYNNNFAFLQDDGLGNVILVRSINGVNNKIGNVGSIDYDNGVISISNLIVQDYTSEIRFIVKPRFDPSNKDIYSYQNTILSIEQDEITIDVKV